VPGTQRGKEESPRSLIKLKVQRREAGSGSEVTDEATDDQKKIKQHDREEIFWADTKDLLLQICIETGPRSGKDQCGREKTRDGRAKARERADEGGKRENTKGGGEGKNRGGQGGRRKKSDKD